jgi:hypothetical protein
VSGDTSAASSYDAVAERRSDIQEHLPRLRREAHGTVLELGVRGGVSTTAFLAGLEERGGTLWSVDIEPSSEELFVGHPQWRFVLADSRDVGALRAAGLTEPIDVLFVDTEHTYEQVRDELGAWGDRVRPGGVILFHDVDSFPEIRRAIARWARPRQIAFEYLDGSNGLGVAYPGAARGLRYRLAVARTRRRTRELARQTAAFPGAVGRRAAASFRYRVLRR